MESQKLNIIRKAENLFLKYGIRSVTMDDIARELSMSKKTLYQYFENKNHLFTELITEHIARDRQEIQEIQEKSTDALNEIENITQRAVKELERLSPTLIFDLQKYHPEFWAMIERGSYDHMFSEVTKNLERGRQEGLYRTDFDIEIIAKLYISRVYAMLDDQLFPPSSYKKEAVFLEYVRYHINAIVSEKGRIIWENSKKSISE